MPDPATPRPVSPVPDRIAGRRPLLRSIVGDVLRRIRLEQRRTLADVARAAQVSMPYLSELERGRKEASSEVLAAICAALRIDLSDLLTEVGRELAVQRPAQVIRLDRARPGTARESRIAPPVTRPGDIQALLAA
jgi:transcriptional regulator with XRE-family HTH domain